MVPRSIGHYRILEKLGEGGMGEVFLAVDTKLDRRVALKLLPSTFSHNAEWIRRLEREAKAVSALNHPNIITIYEIGEVDETRYIAMEFIEGQTLHRQMASTRMKLSPVLDVALQVANALSAAHAAGIVHRDIKPENIMMQANGIVKVLDFGLVKLTEQHLPEVDSKKSTIPMMTTEPGTVMGTVNYMSPEQARGLVVDARTDIFSLGVVLYEMIAGRAPFEGETMSDVIASVLTVEPPPLSSHISKVPSELERIVRRAMEKDRDERYQVVKDMLLDLQKLKRQMEVEAYLQRAAPQGLHDQAARAPIEAAPGGEGAPAPRTSITELIFSGIRHHQLAVSSALALLLVAALSYFVFLARTGGDAIDSIAILPFANVSSDPNTEYLSDGLAESIIYNLSRLPQLKVLPSSSVFRYKGKDTDPQTVGVELGARGVLAGRVIQRGEDLLISAELIDARENRVLWGEQYNRRLADALALQQEISKEIVGQLGLGVSSNEERLVTRSYTLNNESYQAYLKGRYHWNRRNEGGIKKGIEYFQQAIETDPNYALAWSGLADSYLVLPEWSATQRSEVGAKAKAAATRAVELDPSLAEVHTSLAETLLVSDWDFSGAEKAFKRGIKLNPNYATAHQWYAQLLTISGRIEDAMGEIRRAQELEPFSLIINQNLAETLLWAGQYDQAIEQLRTTLELDPDFYVAYVTLALAHTQKRAYKEAMAELNRAFALAGRSPDYVTWLGYTYGVSGDTVGAQEILGEMLQPSQTEAVSAINIAIVSAGLGKKDQAFEWLEKVYQERSYSLLYLKAWPVWDNLRSDPRYVDLLRRIGLPE